MKYPIDTWLKVLEKLSYKIGDEMSKAGSDINCIECSKQTSKYRTNIKIFFNYKTSDVTNIFIISTDKVIELDDFINEHIQYFRDQQINLIIDGNSN
jgi:hypothetical protein